MAENSVKKSVRPQNKNLNPPMKKGETLNPNGRPKGQRNYATIYREALFNIARANNKTAEEIETMLEEVGLKQGLKGNFAFWKDVRDRIHGTAVQRHDHKSGGKPIPIISLSNVQRDDSNKKNNGTE
jgi:hypothetical protein